MSTPPSDAIHLRITGHVQGVGYRLTMGEVARSLGVDGWVRNRRDGSVEAVLRGPPDRVEQLVAWSHQGPPGARVLQVERRAAQSAEAALIGSGFTTLTTA